MFTPDEAAAITLALKWGYLSRDDINELAIEKVEQSSGIPPANICELAMSKRDFEMHEILDGLSEGSEKWASVRQFLKSYVQIGSLTNSEVSKLAQNIGQHADWDDVEPWRNLKILDHEIGDARIGAYGDYDALCQDFKDIISGVLKAA